MVSDAGNAVNPCTRCRPGPLHVVERLGESRLHRGSAADGLVDAALLEKTFNCRDTQVGTVGWKAPAGFEPATNFASWRRSIVEPRGNQGSVAEA